MNLRKEEEHFWCFYHHNLWWKCSSQHFLCNSSRHKTIIRFFSFFTINLTVWWKMWHNYVYILSCIHIKLCIFHDLIYMFIIGTRYNQVAVPMFHCEMFKNPPLGAAGSPMFISQPHFFNGDPKLLEYVNGLNPNKDEHGLFIDIHPVSHDHKRADIGWRIRGNTLKALKKKKKNVIGSDGYFFCIASYF